MKFRSIVNSRLIIRPVVSSPSQNELTRPLPSNPLTGCWWGSVPVAGFGPKAVPSTCQFLYPCSKSSKRMSGRPVPCPSG